jgi:hypothetical protein
MEDRENTGDWRVDRIDDDVGCEVEIFKSQNAGICAGGCRPFAQTRARRSSCIPRTRRLRAAWKARSRSGRAAHTALPASYERLGRARALSGTRRSPQPPRQVVAERVILGQAVRRSRAARQDASVAALLVRFGTYGRHLAHKTTRQDSGLVQGSGNDLPASILPATSGVRSLQGLCESEGSILVSENGSRPPSGCQCPAIWRSEPNWRPD